MTIAQIVHLNLWRTDGIWCFIASDFMFHGSGLRTLGVNKALAVAIDDNSVNICPMVLFNISKCRAVNRHIVSYITCNAVKATQVVHKRKERCVCCSEKRQT